MNPYKKDGTMIKKEYETERLYLKILEPRYAKKVLEYYIRNSKFLKEWDPTRENYFYTIIQQRNLLKEDLYDFKNKTQIKFWLISKDAKEIIGNVCFSNIIMGNFKSCYMSYKLDESEINKGYITEAIKKCISIMFNDFGLHRIEVNIIPRNERSLRIMEKLNFTREGFSKSYLKINDVWEDHVHFAKYNKDIYC
jgi:ribosomal-protein-alanine N-acetyltransferase